MQQQVKVKKTELLTILHANRDKHHSVFLESLDGWRKQADAILQRKHDALRAGKIPNLEINLVTPQDHTPEYDRIIKMVEMDQGDTFELDEQHFAQYVMDDWAWKRQWLISNSGYAGNAIKTAYGAEYMEDVD